MFMLLMHSDYDMKGKPETWDPYLKSLDAAGVLRGGSAIGSGLCLRKEGTPAEVSKSIVGYIKIEAPNVLQARKFLPGNPVYEAGGTVEIRELTVTG